MKLREDINFYKYDENTFHMHDERNDKHFHIGREQKEWLELFDDTRSLEEIRNLIPQQYFESFLEYVYKYKLLDNMETTPDSRINIFKIKIKLANINELLEKFSKMCSVYSIILNRSSKLFLLCSIYFLCINFENILLNVREIFSHSLIVSTLLGAYSLVIITGFFHEFSHAITAKANNVAIPQMGIMFFYFNPALYVDLSGIRILSSREKRIEVLTAGVKMNNLMLLASLLLFNYCHNDQTRNILSVYIVFNLVMILINIIPFVEFDGYYVYSELLNDKNLKLTATIHLKRLIKGEFSKVQIYYILYFVYSVMFSSAFIVLGLTSIIRIVEMVFEIPDFLIIGSVLTIILLNIRFQIKKEV